ncbi:hypothetical protein BH24ACT4_BH24ACT4_20460 [soil metagenome]
MDRVLVGLSEAADQAALGRVWPQVLDFLATNGQG